MKEIIVAILICILIRLIYRGIKNLILSIVESKSIDNLFAKEKAEKKKNFSVKYSIILRWLFAGLMIVLGICIIALIICCIIEGETDIFKTKEDRIGGMVMVSLGLLEVFFSIWFCLIKFTLTDTALVIRKGIFPKKVSYSAMKKHVRTYPPILHKNRLVIMLDKKLLKIPVGSLDKGFDFTNALMLKIGAPPFQMEKFAMVCVHRKNIYQNQYKQMKKHCKH